MPAIIYRITAKSRQNPRGWRVQRDAVGPIIVQGLRRQRDAEACARIYDRAIGRGSTHDEASAGAKVYLRLVDPEGARRVR